MKQSRSYLLFLAFALVLATLLGSGTTAVQAATAVFINEIHYDNASSDIGEAVEIAGPAGTDLSSWSLVLYNGNGGAAYNTFSFTGIIPDQGGGCGTAFLDTTGLQNGSPDGLALVNGTTVVQFLSYEGAFTASGGPANGLTSTDIGVAEPSSAPVGTSMQLTGSGNMDTDFTWVTGVADSFGSPNASQTFVGCAGGGPGDNDHLLLTEIAVTPTQGEFIEIHNPTDGAIDLSDVYLSDATFAGGNQFYYNTVLGNGGGGTFSDFNARFPSGTTIGTGEYQTIALNGSDNFFATFGVNPTYELYEDGASADSIPDMVEAAPGSISGQGGLSDSGEFVVLYGWDGLNDLVTDLDYAVWGDQAEAVDKTGVMIDGPDGDSDASTYLPDTDIASQDVIALGPHSGSNSWQRDDMAEGAETKSGGNGITSHDETSEDVSNTWCETAPTPNEEGACSPTGGPVLIVINEIHADPAFSSEDPSVGDANGDGVRHFGDDEFVEIVNISENSIDMSGWTLSDGAGLRHTFPAETVVPAGCAIVVFGGGTPTGPFGGPLASIQTASTGSLGLSNSGDSVTIRLADGSTVAAQAGYGGLGGNDQSITLDPDVTGTEFVLHSAATGSGSDLFSPGTKIDGSYFSGCQFTFIHDIQGSGLATPMSGDIVLIEGVVVGEFNAGLGGFFVQEEDSDADGDTTTSEGIFVFAPFATTITEGDLVQVVGTVTEFGGLTEITNTTFVDVGFSGHPLPAVTMINMPVASATEWEMYEGMYVAFDDTLTVTDNFNWHRFGELILSADGRQFNPTNFMTPGPAAGDSNGNSVADINELGRIILDDGSTAQFPAVPPHIGSGNTVRLGDSAVNLTGVLSEAFGAYRLQPLEMVEFDRTNPRPAGVTAYSGLVVASVNTLNYWTTIHDLSNPGARGADSLVEFERQQTKLVDMVLDLDAHVVGLQELENNGDVAISALVDALNAATAPGTWAYSPEPTYPGGLQSTNAIRVGIIYQPAHVTPIGEPIADDDPIFATDRPPIAQTFNMSGKIFTVVVNHYKSKGCGGSTGLNTDQGDGQACYNERRRLMSERMIQFVAELQASTGDMDVIVLGDLNSYAEEDPITTLETGLTNQMDIFIPQANQYSFTFFGQSGLLDYIFTSPNMNSQITGLEIWHVNTDEPRALSYNDEVIDPTEFFGNFEQEVLYQPDEFRSSDHDPVRAAFDLNASPDCSGAFPSQASLWPPDHTFRTIDVLGVTDPDGDPVTMTIDSIFQDEAVDAPESGNTSPDGQIVGPATVEVRAERVGEGGNGRFYHISFTANDDQGNSCSGEVLVSVPVARSMPAVDDGALFDSTLIP